MWKNYVGISIFQTGIRDGVWRPQNVRFEKPGTFKGVAALSFGPPPPNTKYAFNIYFYTEFCLIY